MIVATGKNVDSPLQLQLESVIEHVTVSAPAPTLDPRATAAATISDSRFKIGE